MNLKSICIALSVVFLMALSPIELGSPRAFAQDPTGTVVEALTGQGVQEVISKAIKDLQNAAVTVGGEFSISILGISNDLTKKMDDLNKMLQGRVEVPLNQLSAEVRMFATQLLNASKAIDQILTDQQSCFFLNASSTVASLRTIGAEVRSAIPFSADESPRIDGVKFSNSQPYVVPKEGGQLLVSGYRLWDDKMPTVKLLSEDRKNVIKTYDPGHGADPKNQLSFNITADEIAELAGHCVNINVSTQPTKYFLFFPYSGDPVELFAPLCIPDSVATKILTKATVNTHTIIPDSPQGNGSPFTFYAENTSCEDKKTVNDTHEWSLLPGQRISNLAIAPGSIMRNQSNVSVSVINSNSARATGWIDTASCVNLPFGIHRLNAHSVWQVVVTPALVGPAEKDSAREGRSDWQEIKGGENRVCVDVEGDVARPGDNHTYWASVSRKVGNGSEAKFYESERVTTPDPTPATSVMQNLQGISVNSSFNPTLVNGKRQVCVTVRAPACRI